MLNWLRFPGGSGDHSGTDRTSSFPRSWHLWPVGYCLSLALYQGNVCVCLVLGFSVGWFVILFFFFFNLKVKYSRQQVLSSFPGSANYVIVTWGKWCPAYKGGIVLLSFIQGKPRSYKGCSMWLSMKKPHLRFPQYRTRISDEKCHRAEQPVTVVISIVSCNVRVSMVGACLQRSAQQRRTRALLPCTARGGLWCCRVKGNPLHLRSILLGGVRDALLREKQLRSWKSGI